MHTFAHFQSINTEEGIKVFRYFTEFHSVNGPGDVIGLVVMMNPGEARPFSDETFSQLCLSEYVTNGSVLTKPDKTMSKVIRMIKAAFDHNNISLPERYTIHVENLFNVREKDSSKAKKLARNLCDVHELMFKSRAIHQDYGFVFLAWGNTDINQPKQREMIQRFPNAIEVHKLNQRGTLMEVDYPVHPLYMNTQYFLDATVGKINI